jgi:hypothetical protein
LKSCAMVFRSLHLPSRSKLFSSIKLVVRSRPCWNIRRPRAIAKLKNLGHCKKVGGMECNTT